MQRDAAERELILFIFIYTQTNSAHPPPRHGTQYAPLASSARNWNRSAAQEIAKITRMYGYTTSARESIWIAR